MVENNTLKNWITKFESELANSPLISINTTASMIRIMEDDFIVLFNNLLSGKKYKIANLDTADSLIDSINKYRMDNKNEYETFTEFFQEKQNEILKNIKDANDKSIELKSVGNAFLCFGILRYSLDPFKGETNKAPLVLLPIEIGFDEKTSNYYISSPSKEIMLNDPLIDKLKAKRKMDLSYPLDSTFSISDYIYNVSIRVRPLNWTVINYNIITTLDVYSYYSLKDILANKDKISEKDIIKKISYLNSEFLQFNKSKGSPLDSKYLSVLEMNNDEFHLLKKVANKEPLLIKPTNDMNKNHIISNIILSYLLNNQKILVVYSNKDEKENTLNYIKKQGYDRFVLDLDMNNIDKQALIIDLINYNQYTSYKNTNNINLLNDTVKNYYDYKNTFKNLLNGLRTKDNSLKISINKAINQYYKLYDYPTLNINIPDANRFTPEILSRYIQSIRDFSNSISNLNCPIKEHPFYGLFRNKLDQEDYKKIKKSCAELSTYLEDIQTLIKLGYKNYSLPYPTNLKELKATLNILTFASEYKEKLEWINIDNLDAIYDKLVELKENITNLKQTHDNLVNKYTRKIDFVTEDIIDGCFSEKLANKSKKKIRTLLAKNFNSEELNTVIDSLHVYYNSLQLNKEEYNSIDTCFTYYLDTNNLSELRHHINLINTFKNNFKYISKKDNFDIHKFMNIHNRHDLLLLRRALQTIYNCILQNVNIIQPYFNANDFDFGVYNFVLFQKKADTISKNFIKINDYTSFLIESHKVNKLVKNLESELLRIDDSSKYENSFLKAYYKQFIFQSINTNAILKKANKEDLISILNNFSSSDEKRKEIINNIIIEYFNRYLHKKVATLKKEESGELISLLKKGNTPLSLKSIVKYEKNTIFNLKPCVFVPYNSLSYLLNDNEYDAILYCSNNTMTMNDVLSSIYRGKNIMVISNEYNVSINENNTPSSTDNFISNVKTIYPEIYCEVEEEYQPLRGNFIDVYLKQSIYKQLVNKGFDVFIDKIIDGYSIDLLVRIKNTRSSVAVVIDHLSYNSPEVASRNLQIENSILTTLGLFEYRIFPSDYILNEETELNRLIDYIVEKSEMVPEINKKVERVLLMDHLFPKYIDPHFVYYSIDKKTTKPLDLVKEVIIKCAPISVEELSVVMKENSVDLAKKLISNGEIELHDDFYYVPNQKICFRRIERNANIYRPLKYVSNREIYDAIFKVVNHLASISKDTLIKMILLSLGYKKINHTLYDKIDACIKFLLIQRIIFIEDDILYRDFEN